MAKFDTGKYANSDKSGSTEPRNYDPSNDTPGSGSGGADMKGYSPAPQKEGSGPGNAPGSNKGSSS